MAHFETLVGRTTRPVTCKFCEKQIELGDLAAYTKTPKPGSAHLECHLRHRKAAR